MLMLSFITRSAEKSGENISCIHNAAHLYYVGGILSWKCCFSLHDSIFNVTTVRGRYIHVRLTSTWRHTSWQKEASISTRFSGRLEHLCTVHSATRFGNKMQTIKCSPRSPRHIFRSLNLHGVYEHSQGKQKVERESRGREILVWRSLIILLWIAHVRQ